jgi:hypothetical protein
VSDITAIDDSQQLSIGEVACGRSTVTYGKLLRCRFADRGNSGIGSVM